MDILSDIFDKGDNDEFCDGFLSEENAWENIFMFSRST